VEDTRPDDVDRPARRWPDDDLTQFAEEFSASLPELSRSSLARIERRLSAELDRTGPLPHAPAYAFTVRIAAAMAIAVGFVAVVLRDRPEQHDHMPETTAASPPAEAVVVEDRYRVAMVMPAASGVSVDPLLPLDEYRSLIEDVH